MSLAPEKGESGYPPGSPLLIIGLCPTAMIHFFGLSGAEITGRPQVYLGSDHDVSGTDAVSRGHNVDDRSSGQRGRVSRFCNRRSRRISTSTLCMQKSPLSSSTHYRKMTRKPVNSSIRKPLYGSIDQMILIPHHGIEQSPRFIGDGRKTNHHTIRRLRRNC